jgi:hypothetical protein
VAAPADLQYSREMRLLRGIAEGGSMSRQSASWKIRARTEPVAHLMLSGSGGYRALPFHALFSQNAARE